MNKDLAQREDDALTKITEMSKIKNKNSSAFSEPVDHSFKKKDKELSQLRHTNKRINDFINKICSFFRTTQAEKIIDQLSRSLEILCNSESEIMELETELLVLERLLNEVITDRDQSSMD